MVKKLTSHIHPQRQERYPCLSSKGLETGNHTDIRKDRDILTDSDQSATFSQASVKWKHSYKEPLSSCHHTVLVVRLQPTDFQTSSLQASEPRDKAWPKWLAPALNHDAMKSGHHLSLLDLDLDIGLHAFFEHSGSSKPAHLVGG